MPRLGIVVAAATAATVASGEAEASEAMAATAVDGATMEATEVAAVGAGAAAPAAEGASEESFLGIAAAEIVIVTLTTVPAEGMDRTADMGQMAAATALTAGPATPSLRPPYTKVKTSQVGRLQLRS